MSNYSQITDFSAKDSLSTGDPEKAILGSDVDAELAAISTAIASKLNSSGYTAADVLTKIKTVDGASSGLDADSVDAVGPFAVGTYSPTLTEEANLDSISNTGSAMYVRIGSVVFVAGRGTLDVTTGGSNAAFNISLPVASNFANSQDLVGVVGWSHVPDTTGDNGVLAVIEADTTSDDARVVFLMASQTGTVTFTYMFSYRVI